MSRAQIFASGFATCLAAVSIACGGGGGGGGAGDSLETDAQGVCLAQSVAHANALIEALGPMRCKAWAVDGERVYGANYPDFLIGDE